MQDLQEVTQEVHYENFRADKLAGGGGQAMPKKVRCVFNPLLFISSKSDFIYYMFSPILHCFC